MQKKARCLSPGHHSLPNARCPLGRLRDACDLSQGASLATDVPPLPRASSTASCPGSTNTPCSQLREFSVLMGGRLP